MARRTARPLPIVDDLLKDLGESLSLARRRRKISASMMAERAGMTRNTLRAVERGDGGVTIGAYATVLHALGMEKNIKLLGEDELGRQLQEAEALSPPPRRKSRRALDLK
jgi:transcriptional regulator with XRE-family HTH domain